MHRTLWMAVLMGSAAWCQALEQGKRAFDAGNYAEAARQFELAYQASPRCDTLLFVGMARYRLHQPDQALIAFQSAAQCDPKMVDAHLALGEAYAERGDRDAALAAFARVLALNPKNAAALRATASLYLELERGAKALPYLEALVQIVPRDPQVRADLGAAYFAASDLDSAEKQYREALRLNATQPSALLGLGYILIRRGDENDAIPFLQRAAVASPKEYRPHFLLGSAYGHLDRFAEAATEFETAIRLGSQDPEVYYQLARAYGKLDRADDRRDALAKFAELTRKSNQNVEEQRNALKLVEEAGALVDRGELEAAAAKLEAARALRPADDKILFRIAGIRFDLKQLDAARNYVQEAISLAPSEWLYRYLLGLIEKEAGRTAEARKSLDLALRLNATAAEAYDALGELDLKEGHLPDAVARFKKATELDPQQPSYRDHLAAATRQSSRP